jgi:ATP-dependent RNA helicase RhlE
VIFGELNLSSSLLKALAEMGFVSPTPVQEKVFPVIMSGKDVIAIAQTGTGKTLAYLLPVLRQVTFSNKKEPRILILVPTRELVLQVVEEIRKLTAYMSVRVVGVYGGTNINNQKQQLYDGLDILVATPVS